MNLRDCVWEIRYRIIMKTEDHIAGKGENSLQHYNLVHKFIPMLQAMKIPAAKAAVDKEWEKLEKISAWNLTEVKSKKKVIEEAVFTEQGSSASQMTAAKIMDIISRLPGCDGQAADAASAYTQVKLEDAPKLLKIPK